MKTKYYTDDGKVFDNKDEAQAYEAELNKEKAKREKVEQDKRARKDDIKADYEALMEKIEQYNTDYNEPVKWEIPTKNNSTHTHVDILPADLGVI